MFFILIACSDVETHSYVDEQELITAVELSFRDEAGMVSVASWDASDSSTDPVIDSVSLVVEQNYALSVRFLNGLEEPSEDLTAEIQGEGTEHQVFFGGSVFDGILMHSYEDADENGLPIGLDNSIQTIGVGEGNLTLALRHMPQEGAVVIKTEDLAQQVEQEGFDNIGGENDVFVSFPVIVSETQP